MKKVIFGIFLLVLIVFVITRTSGKDEVKPTATVDEVSEIPVLSEKSTVDDNKDYMSKFIEIDDTTLLSLESNLENNLSSSVFKEQFGCNSVINGGFFNTDKKHIGLFVASGKTLSKATKNNLFNGFFYIDNGQAKISYQIPNQSVETALQTGPILLSQSEPVSLNLKSDQYARRIVLAVNTKGNIIIAAFYLGNNMFNGPKLAELGELVKKMSDDYNLGLVDAINLDGGSHSVFWTDQITLKEVSTPGSYFCIKKP